MNSCRKRKEEGTGSSPRNVTKLVYLSNSSFKMCSSGTSFSKCDAVEDTSFFTHWALAEAPAHTVTAEGSVT